MSNTGNTNNNLPRITDMWGKYAKKSTTTTTVKTNGTTITTNGKTKINIFNNTKASGCWNPPDRRKGNVWLNGRNYNVPVHQWASPYNMGGMPSIWGAMPSVNVSYSEPELTGWDKFMQFINIIGPGNIAALLGGTFAGIGGAIGSWFSGDDDKTQTVTAQAPQSQNKNAGYQTISGHDDIQEVTTYNESVGEISAKQNEVSAANVAYLNSKQAAEEAALPLKEAKANIENYDSQLPSLQANFDQAKAAAEADPENTKLQEAVVNAENELRNVKAKRDEEVNKLDGLKQNLQTAVNTMNEKETEYKNIQASYKTFLNGVATKKEAALHAIRQQSQGEASTAPTTTDFKSLLEYEV